MSSSLSPGTTLGRYEIHSQLGAGGMGEVYLAHDTKLDRKIALDGGEETRVFDQGAVNYLFVTDDGVYFSNAEAKPLPRIEFYSFATKQMTTVVSIEKLKYNAQLAVSPDGKWIIYPQIDQEDNDIMLVENFQ